MWSFEDKQRIIRTKDVEEVELSKGSYFVKKVTLLHGVNEIVGMRLAKIMGIKCAEYDLFIIDRHCYSLSKNLNKEGKFKLASVYNIKKNTLYDIWYTLEHYLNNFPEVMNDIVKMYIFDLMFMLSDRHMYNYGFITKDKHTSLVIFDNEYIFNSEYPHMITSLYDREYGLSRENEIKCFLSQSSEEYVDLFKEMYDKVTPEKLEEIITEVEEEYNIVLKEKDSILNKYNNNYKLIGEILKGYGYGRK